MSPRPRFPVARVALSLATAVTTGTCVLDISQPVVAPPETWNPGLNTHPAGPELQALLDEYVRQGLPGVVLLVRSPEGLWNGSAGYARLETADTMLPTHGHHAASVTKMYMAAAIMLLAEDGAIDLDAGIDVYLPESLCAPIPNCARATVRQLLGHRSGIPDFSGSFAYETDFLNDPLGSYPPERLLSYLHGQSAIFSPGERYFYSNANYFLLALIADQVTPAGHAAFISERILRPLDLRATFYKNEPGYPSPPGVVNSYRDFAGDGKLMNVTDLVTHAAGVFMGNAGLIATSFDFGAFIEGLLKGRLMGSESLAAMQSWTEGSRYGLGLDYIDTRFGYGIGHSGGDVGALSQVRYFPDVDATLVLVTNGGDSGVTERLFDRLWADAMETALGGS